MTDSPNSKPEATWSDAFAYPLAAIGAMIGAFLGAVVTDGLSHIHTGIAAFIYGIIAVGILAGYGAPLLARRRNLVVGLIAALVTLPAAIYTEWYLFPWLNDSSLSYFLNHLSDLPPFKIIMHLAGVAIAFYLGYRK